MPPARTQADALHIVYEHQRYDENRVPLMPTLQQLINQVIRAAVWRWVWTLPPWMLWAIVIGAFGYAALHSR
jgi:hypothetical protein